MQTSQHPFAPMRKRMPPCTKVHLRWQHYEMAPPRSSALQKGHAHCPCGPFLPTSGAARQRARRVPRGAGTSNLLRVSHRSAGIMRKSLLDLRTNRINSNRSRLTQRQHKPCASSFAPKRRSTWPDPSQAYQLEAQRRGVADALRSGLACAIISYG